MSGYDYNLRDYLPDVLSDDKEFGIFVDILQEVANDVKYFIDNFNDLIDIDTIPEVFLPKLSYLLSYEYKYQVNTVYQRELIKRMIDVYKNKGTDQDIIDAANNGDNAGWLGNKLFYPGYTYFNNEASIMYPVDHLFRHSVSRLSGQDHFPDGTYWRYGVIVINIAYYTKNLDMSVKAVMPAGVRFYFNLVASMNGDGPNGEVEEGRWVINHEFVLTMHPKLEDYTGGARLSDSRFSDGQHYLSGRRNIFSYLDRYIEMGISYGPQVSNYKSNVFPMRSILNYKASDSGRSSQYSFSVYRSIEESLDAGTMRDSSLSVDSGQVMNYEDYTVGGINLSLLPDDSPLVELGAPEVINVRVNSDGSVDVIADDSFPEELLTPPRFFSIKSMKDGTVLVAADDVFPPDPDNPDIVNPVDPDDKTYYRRINILSGKKRVRK